MHIILFLEQKKALNMVEWEWIDFVQVSLELWGFRA